MSAALPDNDEIVRYSQDVPWQAIEQHKRRFNEKLKQLRRFATDDDLHLDTLSDAAGIPLSLYYDNNDRGNVILGHIGDRTFVMGSFISKRYRFGKPLLQCVIPYNFNPAVNHTNIHETENPSVRLRALGAELELGLYHPDGSPPAETDIQHFIEEYRKRAHTLGITPQVDREACQYQVEVHVAPGTGYHRTRQSLESIMYALTGAAQATGLYTAIFSAYPILSDFCITDNPKVHSAVDVMLEINNRFDTYMHRQQTAIDRYHMDQRANAVEIFRLQGCHIHLDIAGRSEALGLLTFHTLLRSATAIANAALLKGGPFVNGTCDEDLTCTREYLRSTTVTGRFLEMPLSPHLQSDGMARYAGLIESERANAAVRGLLCENGLGEDISAMHNPIGRVRPDLGMSRRICTVESTGMPINISASRQAAALTDFEYTQVLVEMYYREHGTDLQPLQDDEDLWAIIGPLSTDTYQRLQDQSDRVGTDMTLETADGREMSLAEFYEMKRLYMHRALIDVPDIMPREIDDVYTSLNRMLAPPGGRIAQTIEQYLVDPTCRSTGNWGEILRNAFIEAGGTPGSHDPAAVLAVSNRVHEALLARYTTT